MAGALFVATDSVLTTFEGENIYIAPGDIAREGHPILKVHGDKFVAVPVRFEQAAPEPKPEPEPEPAKAKPVRLAAAKKQAQ